MRRVLAAVLLLTAVSAGAQTTCTPYALTAGSFYNNAKFLNVPTTPPATVGNYQISGTATSVSVTSGGQPLALIAIPSGMAASYAFFPVAGPTANRFLLLDIHTYSSPTYYDYSPVLIDLGSWRTGQPPLSGRTLFTASFLNTAASQVHLEYSAGDGLAAFVYIGTLQSGSKVAVPVVYRSDTGDSICSSSTFDPSVQPNAYYTGAEIQIRDGTVVKSSCPLPRGSLSIAPSSYFFGSASPSAVLSHSFSFSNSGPDCLNVTAVSSSAHFRADNFAAFALAPSGAAGSSRSQGISFVPSGAIGTFNESLSFTRNPAIGSSSVALSGMSCSLGDVNNCGTCGNACSAPASGSAVCSSGLCDFTCNGGLTKCGGGCYSTTTDVANCGTCFNACPAIPNAAAYCSAGVCGNACNAGYTLCGLSCVDLLADSSNCGSCGNTCGASSPICASGQCVGPAAPGPINVPPSSGTGTYTISWGASATPSVTYTLQEATDVSFASGLRTVSSGSAATSATVTNPAGSCGRSYFYRVRAEQGGRVSGWASSPAWVLGSCFGQWTYSYSSPRYLVTNVLLMYRVYYENQIVGDFNAGPRDRQGRYFWEVGPYRYTRFFGAFGANVAVCQTMRGVDAP
jgi:hypothetical protein